MQRLSSNIEDLKRDYDVVVVGSGYGGAIVASRLSRAGRKVCVLERGKELHPGEYPDTAAEAAQELQVRVNGKRMGTGMGLYEFHVGRDLDVLVGCGLGGTSLINANVSLRAEDAIFEDERWPKALRAEKGELLARGYELAEKMLCPNPFPEHLSPPAKLSALQRSAKQLGAKFYRPPINVTFEKRVNQAGIEQEKCTLCGDCVSGCNTGAKNTVLMNYLPDAWNHGAEIFTEVVVHHLEPQPNGKWAVHFNLPHVGREQFNDVANFVIADIVFLAAGAMGSTEILHRSKAGGLTVSERLGDRFTGNGDVLGFGYNGAHPVNGVGLGPHSSSPGDVGPCITGIIDLRHQPNVEDGMVVEDAAIPSVVGSLLPEALAIATGLNGTNTAPDDVPAQAARVIETGVLGPYRGAVRNTQTFLVMSHDGDNGTLAFENDGVTVVWPDVGARPLFEKVDRRLVDATRANGGIYTRNPLWSDLPSRNLITVHPLGGCVMADDARNGVVDHKGQVFASKDGDAVHRGLYVCDGAVLPTSLGVNPLLTISALAERCAMLAARDRGWTIDYENRATTRKAEPENPTGLRFTERMQGFFFKPAPGDDYAAAEKRGRDEQSSFEFLVTIVSENVNEMLASPAHQAPLVGTVLAPKLSASPLAINAGVFNLFIEHPDQVDTRRMTYRMRLSSVEGGRYYMSGFKTIHDESVLQLWHDTSTLYITIYQGDDERGVIIGKGVLHIDPIDFARQLTTFQVLHARDAADRTQTISRFGQFFAGVLFEHYGGVFRSRSPLAPDAAPRKTRPLRAPAPRMFPITSSDGTGLLLTRYPAGPKGPVLLSHGLGVSSRIFTIDTIDTNLVEYLCHYGYDVWLLDYRASIALPASNVPYTADDVAKKDYPAAVAAVRELSHSETVQAVVHCYGSTTFFMAMLAGLQGVRSAVASQIATHFVVPTVVGVKAGLHLPDVLHALGISSLDADADKDKHWWSRVYDAFLKHYPVGPHEQCQSAVCHRISFMYSLLYEHAKLNDLTHEALAEMFGAARIEAFEGLTKMVRKGRLVDAKGHDAYLTPENLARLRLPLRFIHGELNSCFLPASTEKTVAALSEANGPGFYSRALVPGYGHIDCIFGRDAAVDVYPLIREHLDAT